LPDKNHLGTAAARTITDFWPGRKVRHLTFRQPAAAEQFRTNIPAAKQPVMPDLHEPVGENMLKKPPGKLGGIKRHHLGFSLIFIILPGKTDRLPVKKGDPGIADGHPVRIAAKIADYMLRRLKRFLTKNHPFLRIKAIHKGSKIIWRGKRISLMKEPQFTVRIGLFVLATA